MSSDEATQQDGCPFATSAADAPGIRRYVRLGVLTLAVLLLTPVGVASQLTPSKKGFGTHQQLGFPPCSSQYLFGVRCPACGMTTSWSNLTHGRPLAAVAANTTGAVMCVLAVLVGVWLAIAGLFGRWVLVRPNEWMIAIVMSTLLGMSIVEWAIRVFAL